MDANRTIPSYKLTDELGRLCLPAGRDPNRRLAWVNSICILFLAVGILGAQSTVFRLKPVPGLPEESVPVVVEPLTPPPTQTPEQLQPTDEPRPESPQVVVVTPDAPSINFAVPTIGNLVTPTALASAPPLAPLRPPAQLKTQPVTLQNTGAAGERPQPPYPRIALEQGQQGTVTLWLHTDEAGIVISAEVKQSSGSPILDRSTLDYVKRHWTVPPGNAARLYEATITYKLQAG